MSTLAKNYIMEDANKPVLDEIIRKAFPQITSLLFKFTEYSLKTSFSFKFDNLAHFVEFLKQHQSIEKQELAVIEAALKEHNLAIDSYFYINFFEENKID